MGTNPKGKVEVAVFEDTLYVRASGMCFQTQGIALHEFMMAMKVAGCKRVVMDLKRCTAMDSTFMGALAATLIAFQETGGLKVINAPQSSRKRLEGLGLLQRLDIADTPCECPQMRLRTLGEPTSGLLANTEVILKVHKDLLALNKDLEAEFGACIQGLEAELKGRRGDATDRDEQP